MAAGRATPPLLKDLNERTVLEAIRAGAPISRAEVSRRVGISKPTVSQALQSLLAAGLVREAEPGGDGPSYGHGGSDSSYGHGFYEPVRRHMERHTTKHELCLGHTSKRHCPISIHSLRRNFPNQSRSAGYGRRSLCSRSFHCL